MNFLKIYKILTQIDRTDILRSSAVEKSDKFLRIVKQINPKIAVEIGTYKGVSTLILSSTCDKVFTFDIFYQKETELLWNIFNVRDKIEYYFCSNEANFNFSNKKALMEASQKYRYKIEEKIKKIEFDFAFIDSCHEYYSEVEADFEMVKHCGCVLFHDNVKSFPGVYNFVKNIGAEKLEGVFALWRK